jgi:dihydropteroate synthase
MSVRAANAAGAVGALRFAGLSLNRPRVMGIINVTPDSFSDGGETFLADQAIARGEAMLADGVDILDVGGESTRPGAEPVSAETEAARVVPVVAALSAKGVLVSVDTRHVPVMAAAITAGARIVNDVTALTGDPGALSLVARTGVAVVLMHMQGDPRTMQEAPRYADVVTDVRDWLAARVCACRAAGVPLDRIAVDPGIGFGKTVAHNVDILARLDAYATMGCGVLIGVSRKSFIGRLSRNETPKARLAGSLAAGLAALMQGASILRVHDVAETHQAIAVWQAITGGWSGAGPDPEGRS